MEKAYRVPDLHYSDPYWDWNEEAEDKRPYDEKYKGSTLLSIILIIMFLALVGTVFFIVYNIK